MKKVVIGVALICCLASPAWSSAPAGSLLDGIKPGADGKIDILTVFAHEDDESIYGGGALLAAKKDPRVRLHILCLTLGDKSDAMKKLRITEEQQGVIRPAELKLAGTVLGAEEVIQFTYHDQGLTSADQSKLIGEIKGVMDRVGAEIVITHDVNGITGHPDHITCSAATTAAFKQSQAQRLYYPLLSPHLYGLRFVFGPEAVKRKPSPAAFKVDIKDEKRMKKLAMYSHVTQQAFSNIGFSMKLAGLYNHEWFARMERAPGE
jgi:N-acetylglucosamine malate deacetylase 2